MEIRLYFEMLRRNWWMIALTVLFALNVALITSFMATPMYQASARFIVSPNPEAISGRDVVNSLEALDKRSIVSTYAEFLNSRRIYQEVFDSLNLSDEEAANYELFIVVLPDANILELTVTGPDRDLAALLANTIGQRAIDYINLLYTVYDISVLDPAIPADAPYSPQPVRDASLALVLGLLSGIALAILSEQILIPLDVYRQRLRLDNESGVFTNRYFRQLVNNELLSKPNDLLSIGIVELNELQEVLDTMPPVASEKLLRKVTKVLRKELRGNDVIGRWNQTSFIVMLPTTSAEAALRTFERIYTALNIPMELDQYGITVSLNPVIGGSVFSDDITGNELLDQAVKALESARRNVGSQPPINIWQMKNPFWTQKEQ